MSSGFFLLTLDSDDHPEMVNSRDSVMIRLLDTCVKLLAEQGMRQLFIDGMKGGDDGFQSLGKCDDCARKRPTNLAVKVSGNGRDTRKFGERFKIRL